jgi:hypothetical protein
LKAALVETVGFDTVGRLTWDAAALPGADNAEILEGYTLRPNQVRVIWRGQRADPFSMSVCFAVVHVLLLEQFSSVGLVAAAIGRILQIEQSTQHEQLLQAW